MRLALLIASALVTSSAFAQTPGSCETGTALRFLDVSNVQASLFNTGGLFFGGSTTSGDGYLVPKASGNSPIFAAGIWLSGTVDSNIRVSAARYGSYLFRPGPLNADGTLPNATDCSAYDRIYVVSTYDVTVYEETGVASSDLAEWPVGLGAPAVDANGQLVEITSREQTLELANGERPVLSGTQTAFWVMNDVGAPRGDGRTAPLGVEVQVTAFVIATNEGLLGAQESSFYRFQIINRSANTIENTRLTFFTDPDLGDASDDYVGTDTTRGMGFVYNDSNEDAAYGSPPPAVGYDMLSHGLAATHTFIGGGPDGTQDPGTPQEYYHYMQGLWGNGTPIYELGNGFEQTGVPTIPFFYAGDPVTKSAWSEVNTDGNGAHSPQGDRRYVATSALSTLAPGDTATVDLAVLFALGTSNLDSITELRAVSDGVQAAYDNGSLFRATEPTPLLATPDLLAPADASTFDEERVLLSWTPVPDATLYRVEQSTSPSFEDGFARLVDSTSTWGALGVNDTTTYHWRVRAESPSRQSPFSEARSYTSNFYQYLPGVERLADGSPAYVEVASSTGADPCAETALSRDGCDEVGANLVYHSLNSTGEYYFSNSGSGSEGLLANWAPNDFEIRFTDAGSIGYFRFQGGGIVRVPFEIWDIGVVAPGETSDPADDVRMIPVFFADNGGSCAFSVDEIPDGDTTTSGYVETDRVYAYHPIDGSSYAAYEAQFAASVDADADGCFEPAGGAGESSAFVVGSRAIQRQVFGSSSDAPAFPKTGTVIRMYTTDPRPVSDEATPHAGTLMLGPAYPNPAASSLRVPYRLASSQLVELAVYDVLGRRVVELVDARQLEGTHTAALDASALAPGVYVVRLRAGEDTRSTRITIVR